MWSSDINSLPLHVQGAPAIALLGYFNCCLPFQLIWLTICMVFVGALPEGAFKKRLHYQVYTSCFQILGGAISAVITHHNQENKPVRGICVANHTSPIDVLVMACDNAYALVRTTLTLLSFALLSLVSGAPHILEVGYDDVPAGCRDKVELV